MNDKQREELQKEIKKAVDVIDSSYHKTIKRWEKDEKELAVEKQISEITNKFVGKVEDFYTLSKKGLKND